MLWQRGMRSEVFLEAEMPAMRDTERTSPFFIDADLMSLCGSGFENIRWDSATARREVDGLLGGRFTMRAEPDSLRWVSVGAESSRLWSG